MNNEAKEQFIFNFFEGNLSPSEEALFYDLVKADSTFKKDYEYWKKSYDVDTSYDSEEFLFQDELNKKPFPVFKYLTLLFITTSTLFAYLWWTNKDNSTITHIQKEPSIQEVSSNTSMEDALAIPPIDSTPIVVKTSKSTLLIKEQKTSSTHVTKPVTVKEKVLITSNDMETVDDQSLNIVDSIVVQKKEIITTDTVAASLPKRQEQIEQPVALQNEEKKTNKKKKKQKHRPLKMKEILIGFKHQKTVPLN